MDKRQLKFNFEDLPEGWKVTNLGEFCEFYNGKAHEKCIDENGEFIVINSKFISSDGKITKRTKENLFPLYKNDIVMVMSDVPKGKALAKCYIIEKHNKYSLNQRICAIRSDKFDINFLYYHLNRHPYLLSFDNGENQTNLRKDDILKCPLFFPSLDEQKRIVAILDEAFEGIDQAIRNTEKNLANARELFDSYLNKIFTQKGDDWEEKKLDKECEILMGQSPKGSSYNSDGIGIPLINGPVEFGGIEPFSKTVATKFTTEPTKICKEGDLILCVRGSTTGRMNIAGQEACIGRGVAAIRSKYNNQDWVNHFISFSKNKIYALGSGSTFPNISSSELKKIIIPLPPKDQRNFIVSQIKFLSKENQYLETIYRQKLAALNELKQSILQKAFTGQLTK